MSRAAEYARRRIADEHQDVIAGIDACADAVAHRWEEDSTGDRAAVVEPLRTCLDARGLLARLPSVLAAAVEATGHDLAAPPVAAPPYVVVTSQGPVLRATIDPGRLVIRLEAFTVVRESESSYRRLEGTQLAVSLE
ncbi:hypothetical protein [Natronobeatus ordinarius]|uniref:hypothetical protein n=1 Tax=Natronobeatus ordinarius TaxID=2963433 RepID=UPI0020CD6C1F|nr:hypothetical protein [Natronobeatus ordinarius]